MSDVLSAVVLGVVEGLTEFVPVSSTGHLIVTAKLLAFEGATADTFEIFIQSGAILAAVVLYWKRFLGLIDVSSRAYNDGSFEGLSGLVKLGVCSFPALLLGALFHKMIKEQLFNPTSVAIALIIGGIALVVIERKEEKPTTMVLDQVTLKQCLAIGVFQCASLWPGISRAASTIIGGKLCGLSRKVAAEFSFLAAVPVILAATAYDLLKSASSLSSDAAPLFAIGFLISFFTGMIAIRGFVALLSRFTLQPFGIYRIALGALILAFGV